MSQDSSRMNVSQFADDFANRFGAQPKIFRAPGRVNLIGEHTDYNDGFVMPAAIGFSTYVAIAPRADGRLVLCSAEFPEQREFEMNRLPEKKIGVWCDYVVGVASVLQHQGQRFPGASLLIHGEVPIGSGLSSSAAIEVSSALAFISLNDAQLALPEVAQLCRQAENTFVGARVGIMDQFVSCMGKAGHAFLLDCRSLEYKFAPIPAGLRIVVCNTMVKHENAGGEYNTRRAECEEGVRFFAALDPEIRALRDVSIELLQRHASGLPTVIQRRCTHVVYENRRTLDAARALERGDLARVGVLMSESHASLRDLYEVSCRELDIMVESAQGLPGFCGGRMTGGGFGGCTVNLVREENATEFSAQVRERYRSATGIDPQIYLCSAENGAGQVS